MKNIIEFMSWGLERVKRASVPAGAALAVPLERVGSVDEWEYLFGTTAIKCTAALLKERYNNYYKKQNWTETAYNNATKDFIGKTVCDCNGVLDAYRGEDKNAAYTYANYCTEKGLIMAINRPYVIGEAVFRYSDKSKKMVHIGWICGFMPDNTPLVMEERGLLYGFVITKLTERNFTHRGLMTAIFDYSGSSEPAAPTVLSVTSPIMQGANIAAVQNALNLLGYTDDNGNALTVDGKCGKCTVQAVRKFAKAHTPAAEHIIALSVDEKNVFRGVLK